MSGGIIDVLHFAIDGLTRRQDALANDLANVETPGYTATDVSFEQSLQNALAQSGTQTASIVAAPSANPPASNGNNVSLSNDLVAAERTMLQYQTTSDLLNAQFRLVQGSAGGSYQ